LPELPLPLYAAIAEALCGFGQRHDLRHGDGGGNA